MTSPCGLPCGILACLPGNAIMKRNRLEVKRYRRETMEPTDKHCSRESAAPFASSTRACAPPVLCPVKGASLRRLDQTLHPFPRCAPPGRNGRRSGTAATASAGCWNTYSLRMAWLNATAAVETTRELVKSSPPTRSAESQCRRSQRRSLPHRLPGSGRTEGNRMPPSGGWAA